MIPRQYRQRGVPAVRRKGRNVPHPQARQPSGCRVRPALRRRQDRQVQDGARVQARQRDGHHARNLQVRSCARY